jgi:hypothetical protein
MKYALFIYIYKDLISFVYVFWMFKQMVKFSDTYRKMLLGVHGRRHFLFREFGQEIWIPGYILQPDSIRVMGDKSTARETMKKAGVPTVPGSDGLLQVSCGVIIFYNLVKICEITFVIVWQNVFYHNCHYRAQKKQSSLPMRLDFLLWLR